MATANLTATHPTRKELTQFFSKLTVNPETACWEWCGAINSSGYGHKRWRNRLFGAYQLSYFWFVGQVPAELELDHLCRNRRCVAPYHLEAVTRQVNVLRGISPFAKLAQRTTCNQGHPLTGENVQIRENGARRCITCRRQYHRQYQKQWRELHPDATAVQQKRSNAKRREYQRQWQRDQYRANPEHIRAKNRADYQKHREKRIQAAREARRRKKQESDEPTE